jgi:hypothetical protein
MVTGIDRSVGCRNDRRGRRKSARTLAQVYAANGLYSPSDFANLGLGDTQGAGGESACVAHPASVARLNGADQVAAATSMNLYEPV